MLPKHLLQKISQRIVHYYTAIQWYTKSIRRKLWWLLFRNKPITTITYWEQKIYSQNGEDGIIDILLHKIPPTTLYCVEFGVGNGSECNTRTLIEKKNWNYLHMDSTGNNKTIKRELVTAENIEDLFKKYNVPKEFHLLSIDVDMNDYWIWKALTQYQPAIVVIEYNAHIPPPIRCSVPYNPTRVWDHTDYFGASLSALCALAKEKKYTLVGCDSRGVNAFFVRNDLVSKHFPNTDINLLYKSPQYGSWRKNKTKGHPMSTERMITV